MAYKARNQVFVSVAVPEDYQGQHRDLKELARRKQESLGRLMLQALRDRHSLELEAIRAEAERG